MANKAPEEEGGNRDGRIQAGNAAFRFEHGTESEEARTGGRYRDERERSDSETAAQARRESEVLIPLTNGVGASKGRRHVQPAPEMLELEMPRRKTRIGKGTRAIIEMEVNPSQPLFFKRPPDVDLQVWSNRIGSWVAAARRQSRGTYCKRMVEFENEDGVAVWRTK